MIGGCGSSLCVAGIDRLLVRSPRTRTFHIFLLLVLMSGKSLRLLKVTGIACAATILFIGDRGGSQVS